MDFVPPKFNEDAFHCPFCGVYAHMKWTVLLQNSGQFSLYQQAICARCDEGSIWHVTDYTFIPLGFSDTETKYSPRRMDSSAEMIFPDYGVAESPAADMPDDVKEDYLEASRIFSRSPRGAAALLRLSLQKLCKHLGESGVNINDDIRSLAKKNNIPQNIINTADAVRIIGNNAVHPGVMSDADFDCAASHMFSLINFIVRRAITEPREVMEIYNRVPENPRKAAEAADARAKKQS